MLSSFYTHKFMGVGRLGVLKKHVRFSTYRVVQALGLVSTSF